MAIIQNLEAFVQSYPAGLDSVTDLQLSQNENGRQIRFTIGGVTIPAGSVATISGTKPDGVVYSNTGTIEGADTVIFDEDVQMTAVFGTWYAKIRITNAGNTIASARVRFIIDKDPVDAGAIPSESQLDGLVAEAEEYAEAAGDAAERAAITYGSPLTASTAAAMTDVNRVYVYTGSESGYTYGNWYYYNGSAWVSGGVYNSAAVETDTTLTESGVPADAKATGDKIAELKDDLNQFIEDFGGSVDDAVNYWLDEHPEATTTVQDGSLTEAKFSNALKLATVKDYVTPEMFGAVGDGESDDTSAVLDALEASNYVYFRGSYLITEPIVLESSKIIRCDGSIKYSGDSSAIIIKTSYCYLDIKHLETNKNGISFIPTGTATLDINCSMNIVNIENIICTGSSGNGIFIDCSSGCTQFNKITVNRLQGGWSLGTNNGLHIITGANYASQYCNGNLFDIHSICFCMNAVYVESAHLNSCTENQLIHALFESNTYSLNISNARMKINACFEESSCGKIVITDCTGANIDVDVIGRIRESVFDIDYAEPITCYYHFNGLFYDDNGNFLCDGLYISSYGTVSPNMTTPHYTLNTLTKLYGGKHITYLANGDTVNCPALRRSGLLCPMSKYEIFFKSATGSGTFTLAYEDGTTASVTISGKYSGVIVVVPNAANDGQWHFVF